jgi:hypothetical protein
VKFFVTRSNVIKRKVKRTSRGLKEGPPHGLASWPCARAHFGPEHRLAFLFLQDLRTVGKAIPTYFYKVATEAKVLFFSGRGHIMLLYGHRRGEIDIDIATNTTLAWVEVSSSLSTTTLSSSSSTSISMSSLSHFM